MSWSKQIIDLRII